MSEPTRVVSIAGSDRSGSTLLDTILGTVDGFFSAGELRYLWERGILQERLCGCSEPIPRCEVWSRVLEAHPELSDAARATEIVEELKILRTRYAPLAMTPGLRGLYERKIHSLTKVFGDLLPTTMEVTGSQVIVDSSKRPLYTFMLSLIEDIELTVVHVVRDPRAVAHSRNRFKKQVDSGEDRGMTQTSPLRSALAWDMWNTAVRSLARRLPRYVVVRYEDLIADPSETVAKLLAVIGVPDAATPFINGSTVTLQPNHTVSGNPSRFNTGDIELELDAAWRTDMSDRNRRLVTTMTAPWLGRYGYRRSGA